MSRHVMPETKASMWALPEITSNKICSAVAAGQTLPHDQEKDLHAQGQFYPTDG